MAERELTLAEILQSRRLEKVEDGHKTEEAQAVTF